MQATKQVGRPPTEEEMLYIMSAPTVEEGSRRVCEVEDRIWLEAARAITQKENNDGKANQG